MNLAKVKAWPWRLIIEPAGPLQIVGISFGSLALSALLIGSQVFRANWGVIDDHQTLRFIGIGNHHLALNQYFDVLRDHTELGRIGHSLRFRPFYYPALLFEAVIWGDNVHLWYACRVMLFAIFIACTWIAISRFLGTLFGVAAVFYIVRKPFWGDVWARLSPGEIYATTGLGIWTISLLGMFSGKSTRAKNLSLFGITLGAAMMVGSKEPLFPFVGYTVCALCFFLFRDRRSFVAMVCLVFTILYGGASGIIIHLALSKSREDFLGEPINFVERLRKVFPELGLASFEFLIPAVVLCLLTAAVLRRAKLQNTTPNDAWLKATSSYFLGVFGLWSLYLTQYIAYNGTWPTGDRYDFPGQLALPAFLIISLIYAIAVLQRVHHIESTLRWVAISIAATSIPIMVKSLPFQVSKAAALNIRATSTFQAALQQIVELANSNPQKPIILRANGAWSYEKIISVSIYLRRYGVVNAIAVHFIPEKNLDPRIPASKFNDLGREITKWQDNGREYLVPLESVEVAAKSGCISIGLDGPVEPVCRGVEI